MIGKSHLRFSTLAPYYDLGLKLLAFPFGGERRVRQTVLDLLPLEEGERVLDIGCGTGTVSLLVAERLEAKGKVVGVDPSPEMLERARAKVEKGNFPHVQFLDGCADSLPFPDSSFDAVIFFLVVHEMTHADRIASLREAWRLVREGGFFLFGELHTPENPLARFLMRGLLIFEEEEARDFLSRGLCAIVEEAWGFRASEAAKVVFAGGLAQGVLYVKGKNGSDA